MQPAIPALALFDRLDHDGLLGHVSDEERLVARRDDWLRCTGCGRVITSEREEIEVQGSRAHVRINPHGRVFHFRCFRDAPGCAQMGPGTLEHTWFAGFRWQIAQCSGCGVHLGWRFDAPDGQGFFGLIKDRLERNI